MLRIESNSSLSEQPSFQTTKFAAESRTRSQERQEEFRHIQETLAAMASSIDTTLAAVRTPASASRSPSRRANAPDHQRFTSAPLFNPKMAPRALSSVGDASTLSSRVGTPKLDPHPCLAATPLELDAAVSRRQYVDIMSPTPIQPQPQKPPPPATPFQQFSSKPLTNAKLLSPDPPSPAVDSLAIPKRRAVDAGTMMTPEKQITSNTNRDIVINATPLMSPECSKVDESCINAMRKELLLELRSNRQGKGLGFTSVLGSSRQNSSRYHRYLNEEDVRQSHMKAMQDSHERWTSQLAEENKMLMERERLMTEIGSAQIEMLRRQQELIFQQLEQLRHAESQEAAGRSPSTQVGGESTAPRQEEGSGHEDQELLTGQEVLQPAPTAVIQDLSIEETSIQVEATPPQRFGTDDSSSVPAPPQKTQQESNQPQPVKRFAVTPSDATKTVREKLQPHEPLQHPARSTTQQQQQQQQRENQQQQQRENQQQQQQQRENQQQQQQQQQQRRENQQHSLTSIAEPQNLPLKKQILPQPPIAQVQQKKAALPPPKRVVPQKLPPPPPRPSFFPRRALPDWGAIFLRTIIERGVVAHAIAGKGSVRTAVWMSKDCRQLNLFVPPAVNGTPAQTFELGNLLTTVYPYGGPRPCRGVLMGPVGLRMLRKHQFPFVLGRTTALTLFLVFRDKRLLVLQFSDRASFLTVLLAIQQVLLPQGARGLTRGKALWMIAITLYEWTKSFFQ